jgi:hypothetical protein
LFCHLAVSGFHCPDIYCQAIPNLPHHSLLSLVCPRTVSLILLAFPGTFATQQVTTFLMRDIFLFTVFLQFVIVYFLQQLYLSTVIRSIRTADSFRQIPFALRAKIASRLHSCLLVILTDRRASTGAEAPHLSGLPNIYKGLQKKQKHLSPITPHALRFPLSDDYARP